MDPKLLVDSDLMVPAPQDGLDGTDNAEGLYLTQANTLREYWAEVVEEQEISLAEQFRRLYRLHDNPQRDTPTDFQHVSSVKSCEGKQFYDEALQIHDFAPCETLEKISAVVGCWKSDMLNSTKKIRDSDVSTGNPESEDSITNCVEIHEQSSLSCDTPRPDNLRKAQSEHNSSSTTDRSTTFTSRLSAERQSPIIIENSVGEDISDSRIHGNYFAAGAQDSLKDEDYEQILKEEMDAMQTEYDPGLDWISIPDPKEQPFLPISVLIPFSLNSDTKPSEAEKERVAIHRERVQYFRYHIQSQKDFLRRKEETFFNENEKFMKLMREWIAGDPGPKDKLELDLETVTTLLAVSKSKADEFGPLIHEIGLMEDKLAAEELKLTRAEDKLHRSYGIAIDRAKPNITPDDIKPKAEIEIDIEHMKGQTIDPKVVNDSNTGDDSSSMSFFSESNYPPLWIEWQSRRGDEDIWQERCAELWFEKEQLEERKETRQRVGLKLQKDDEDFLLNFENLVTSVEEELAKIQQDVRRLRDLCFEEGIIDENGELVDNSKGGSENVNGEGAGPNSDNTSTIQSASERGIPKTSNEASSLQPAKPTPDVETTLRGDDLGQPLEEQAYQSRINPWLLEKLTASNSEVALLATIVKAAGKEPDENTVDEVLKFWESDGAGYAEPPKLPQIDDNSVFWKLRKTIREIRKDGYDKGLVMNLFGFSLWGKRPGRHKEGSNSYFLDPE
jgi:hypothetical protein